LRPSGLFAGLLLLVGCGGGGGGSNAPTTPVQQQPPAPQSDFDAGTFQAFSNFEQMCAAPRTGNFPDTPGTTQDENDWLRSWSNELYLWYDEITDQDPANFTTPDYFDLMKTVAQTPSGADKDRFHFTIPTDEWIALSQSGVSAGYGSRFAIISPAPPREVTVAFTDPNTPAAAAGLFRGARILQVDGVDIEFGNDADALNNAFFPSNVGESHQFVVRDLGSADTRTFTMVADTVTADPVQFEQVIDTPSGPVGYLFFSTHIATSEAQLVEAMAMLEAQSVTDLIVDLRYNGGGFLDIANQLAYMIAGPSAASGRTFSELLFNAKHTVTDPVTGEALTPRPFHETTQGFSATAGEPLPTLNLPRVFVLTGAETCSASEGIINGLRGIDVEVILIGSTTCGKPYGFYAFDNCGATYFSVQFASANAKGFSDFGDGFSPADVSQVAGVELAGCSVADDFDHSLGDVGERRLAAALDYRSTGACPAATGFSPALVRTEQAFSMAADSLAPDPAAALAPPAMPGMVIVR
jgi:carboxyl-terminal processing protease